MRARAEVPLVRSLAEPRLRAYCRWTRADCCGDAKTRHGKRSALGRQRAREHGVQQRGEQGADPRARWHRVRHRRHAEVSARPWTPGGRVLRAGEHCRTLA
eukprot:Amastigsp_a687271_5.p4 type:complete len:101 gc:universal Amastigsp_a687271_5:301-603(+)